MDIPSSDANASPVTPELAAQIDTAIASLPPAHCAAPVDGESFQSGEEALKCLQDWAFTQGFAVVTESGRQDRIRFQCVHHKKKTRNTRKTDLEGRERLGTQTRAKGCTWQVYISQRKKTGALWILGWTHHEHNHLANPDPFSYDQHKAKKPGFASSIQRATMH